MKTWHPGAILLPVIALVALIDGCTFTAATPPLPPTQAASPASSPSSTIAVRATATMMSATASPTPDRLPDGWTSHENHQVRLSLPPDWQVIEMTSVDAQAALENLKQDNLQMAGIIGSPDALLSAALWAFGPPSEEYTDNLNVRRSPLGVEGITDMQGQVLDLLLPQLEMAGFDVSSTDASLRINGLPAARITYTLPMSSTSKQSFDIRGRQYLVLTDTDLWILSYSTTQAREARLAPVFEQSARSFRPR